MALRDEQLRLITKKVEDCLKDSNIYSKVRESIKEVTNDENRTNWENDAIEQVARALEEKIGHPDAVYPPDALDLDPDLLYLQVTLVQGRAFTCQLADNLVKQNRSVFQVHLQFNGQRAQARPVLADVEPCFEDQSFTFSLGHLPEIVKGWVELLDLDCPLHFCVTRQRAPKGELEANADAPLVGRKDLLASAVVDWRRVLLVEEEDLVVVELTGSGPDSGFNEQSGISGLLQVKLRVFSPRMDDDKVGKIPLDNAQIERIIQLKESTFIQSKRYFYLYAKNWWEEYMELSEEFAKRKLKLLAEDERGSQRSVCSFLWPYRVGRLLETPHHAARFVSLLPFQRNYGVGGRLVDTWHSFPTLLAQGGGDAADHALLLCSLLLGFGMDAYVATGTAGQEPGLETVRQKTIDGFTADTESPHTWVITFNGNYAEQEVTFWESLTGAQFFLPQQVPSEKHKPKPHHFLTISCIFNHERLFANKQRRDSVKGCNFDLANDALWKPMDEQHIEAVPHELTDIILRPPIIDADLSADTLERDLRDLIDQYRDKQGFTTVWDEDLSYVLQPSLAAYELDRLAGVTFGNEYFQNSLKRLIPNGHCFKGFPLFVPHLDTDEIFQRLKNGKISKDILDSHGDYTRFAIRVKVVPYPEELAAVWIMLAVKYQPVVTI